MNNRLFDKIWVEKRKTIKAVIPKAFKIVRETKKVIIVDKIKQYDIMKRLEIFNFINCFYLFLLYR